MIIQKMRDVAKHNFAKTGESPLEDMQALCIGAITLKKLMAQPLEWKIDNNTGSLIVDNRLEQLRRKAKANAQVEE